MERVDEVRVLLWSQEGLTVPGIFMVDLEEDEKSGGGSGGSIACRM